MRTNFGRLLGAIGTGLILGLPEVASAGPAENYGELRRLLRPGDVVAITQWTGPKVTGRLADVGECSIVVIAGTAPVELPAAAIKTVRRHTRAPAGPTNRLADTGQNCTGPGCMAIRLTLAGTTGVTRRIQKLFHRPEVVYRARHRDAARRVCPLPVALHAATRISSVRPGTTGC